MYIYNYIIFFYLYYYIWYLYPIYNHLYRLFTDKPIFWNALYNASMINVKFYYTFIYEYVQTLLQTLAVLRSMGLQIETNIRRICLLCACRLYIYICRARERIKVTVRELGDLSLYRDYNTDYNSERFPRGDWNNRKARSQCSHCHRKCRFEEIEFTLLKLPRKFYCFANCEERNKRCSCRIFVNIGMRFMRNQNCPIEC